MPQPWPGWASGSRSLIRRTSSGADGAPPYDTASMLREIVFVEARVFEHLPGDGGHAAEIGDALALDELERLIGVPAPLHHELVAVHHRRHITAKQPVAWKNGTDISGAFCGHPDRARAALRPGGGRRAPGPRWRSTCWDDVAVACTRPSASRWCPRCRRWRRRRRARAARPAAHPWASVAHAVGRPEHVFQARHPRIGDLLPGARDIDVSRAGQSSTCSRTRSQRSTSTIASGRRSRASPYRARPPSTTRSAA